jgi:hypothetical protein
MKSELELPAGGTPKSALRWLRWASIGCGVIVLVLVLALGWGAFSSRRMMVWGLTRLANRVLASLPPATPTAVREELHRKFACVLSGAQRGVLDERRLGGFARACSDALADRRVEPDEMERLDALATRLCRDAGDARR